MEPTNTAPSISGPSPEAELSSTSPLNSEKMIGEPNRIGVAELSGSQAAVGARESTPSPALNGAPAPRSISTAVSPAIGHPMDLIENAQSISSTGSLNNLTLEVQSTCQGSISDSLPGTLLPAPFSPSRKGSDIHAEFHVHDGPKPEISKYDPQPASELHMELRQVSIVHAKLTLR